MTMLRSLLLLLSFIFVTSQSYGFVCHMQCTHADSVVEKASQAEDHSCCDETGGSESEPSHDCEQNHCFQAVSVPTSPIIALQDLSETYYGKLIAAQGNAWDPSFLEQSNSIEVLPHGLVYRNPIGLYLLYQSLKVFFPLS